MIIVPICTSDLDHLCVKIRSMTLRSSSSKIRC